jgi:hypothetical protein
MERCAIACGERISQPVAPEILPLPRDRSAR